jgi:hypothetical protein
MDSRVQETQRLMWEIELLCNQGADRTAEPLRRKMAELHEQRAQDLLSAHDPDGWIDLFAAITAWGEAGMKGDAIRLIAHGRQTVGLFPEGRKNLEEALDELQDWLDVLPGVPPLKDFDRSFPGESPR